MYYIYKLYIIYNADAVNIELENNRANIYININCDIINI